MANENPIKLIVSLDTLKTMKPIKEFTDSMDRVMDSSVSEDCTSMVVSVTDAVQVFNLNNGTRVQNLECKKYGVGLLKHTDNQNIVHSSIQIDDTIRLLSLESNKYIRYIVGHTDKVNSIAMCESRNSFFSSSNDKTVRYFDLRTSHTLGGMNFVDVPLVASDPEGVVIAVATNSKRIRLYDVRSFDVQHICEFNYMPEDGEIWSHLEFSPCGKFILVSTNCNIVRLIDSFSGELKQTFNEHTNFENITLRATITPCSKFVMVGSSDRTICVYNTTSGSLVSRIPTTHIDAPHILSFNPKSFSMASIRRKLLLWAPSEQGY